MSFLDDPCKTSIKFYIINVYIRNLDKLLDRIKKNIALPLIK